MIDNSKEYIICSAIHYDNHIHYPNMDGYGINSGFVIGGYRHHNIISVLPTNIFYKGVNEKVKQLNVSWSDNTPEKGYYCIDIAKLILWQTYHKYDLLLNKKQVKGLYLSGSFGSGKTYLIAALFNELAKKDISSALVYYPELLRTLKSSFQTDYEEKFNYIKTVPLLLIDDIGAENTTSWSRDEVLGPILQYRMEEELPTFFTSNLTLKELEANLSTTSDGVSKVKAKRIVERIKQLTTSLELVSKNRRN